MNSSDPGEDKKSDNCGNGQNIAAKDEGNSMPTFINNWAPLPSAASATSALNIGSTLNINLPNFYQGSGGSVISGPPLLGGVMLSSGVPSGNNSSSISSINSGAGRPEYLSMGVHTGSNVAGLSVGQIPLPGSNSNAVETGQRSHSNSFNGYGYAQHAFSSGHNAPVMSNSGGNLASTSGLVSNHIDFMNINNSPPLLSSASAASSGMFLTSLPGKGNDAMGMINHSNMYSSMHGILPTGSTSFTNLSAFRDQTLDPSQSTNVGVKRPPTINAPATSAVGNSNTTSTNANAPNKRAKAAANRGRAASTTAEVPGTSLPQPVPAETANTPLPSTVPNVQTRMNPVPPVFDGGSNPPTVPVQQMPARPTALQSQPQSSAPPPLTSATITYPIISSYKATSVMTTGGAAYMPPASTATLHTQNVSHGQHGGSGTGSGAGPMNMQSNHAMSLAAPMNSAPQLNGGFTGDGSPRPYTYVPPNSNNSNNMHMQQQLSQQHPQIGQNLGYNGASPGMTYMQQQQQQQNAYHRQQPMMNNGPNSSTQGAAMYGHPNNGVSGPTGNMQMPNYPLNPLNNPNNMNMQNMQMQHNMHNMQNMQQNNNQHSSMQNNNQMNAQNNVAQSNANNKAAPARARVRNKTPRPGKKALAAAAALAGAGEAVDGAAPVAAGEGANVVPAPPVVKPMTYKEKRAASSKKAMAAAAAAAAAEAERTGEPLAPGLVVPVDARRKDTKRDRDNSLVEGETGRSEREKAEKEESTTALLKRREPIVQRIEEIEDSKFLGRKGPSFTPPAITPVPSHTGQVNRVDEEWDGSEGVRPAAQARGLRDEGRRPKTHWDYVLQEVQWMAVDFRQELRWKLAASKHTAEACVSSSSRCVAKLSSTDAISGRTAAKMLAHRVNEYWQRLSDCVTTTGGQAVELCKLMSNDYSSELFPDQEADTVKPENINKLTDKILSLPTLIRSSGSGSSLDEASTPLEKTKSAYFHVNANTVSTSSGNAPITLLSHQLAALQQVKALNAEKFGAVMYGKSYIGKTTTACELTKEWLVRRDGDRFPVVLVVAERKCVYRWATELRTQQALQVEVWSIDALVEVSAESKVLVVSTELLSAFLQTARFKNMAGLDNSPATEMDVEGSAPVARCGVLQGVFVDRRCVSDVSNTPTAASRTSSRAPLGVLGELAASLDRRLTQRCLIVEDAFLPGNILESLSFLSPGTHFRDWEAKYPAGVSCGSCEESCESHQEQIVRNTLNQLLSNLSVAVKLPINADSAVAAQTRVEVVAPEMDSAQAKLYHTVMSHLARHPVIYSGENTTKLAAALVLLRKVCFHTALVTHKGQGVMPSRYMGAVGAVELRHEDIQQRSELDSSEAPHGGVVSSRPSLANVNNSYAATGPPLRAPSSYDLYWANNDRTGLNSVRSGADSSPAPADFVYSESTFSRGPLGAQFVETSDFADILDQGSCKLQGLRRLLRRFAGLKVAVLIETQEECWLVKRLLEKLNIQHEVAFAPTSHHAVASDSVECDASVVRNCVQSAELWVSSQFAVQAFNSPLYDTCVLLCSKHVFQPPNMPPQQADAVVVLSDDWTCTTEVRDCFRLRLLSAGPTGPPLTVVRVVAGGTIEERMARKGGSLLQLQGTPMSQVWPGAKSPLSLTAIPNSFAYGSTEPTLLSKAPILVLPTAPKSVSTAISPIPGAEVDISRSGNGSPMMVSTDGDVSKRNSDSSLRGKGKGFIVQGKQGSTTFVKDQGPLQGLGFSRGRSGVLPGLGAASADPLRQPESLAWLQQLHRDFARLAHSFDARSCSVKISTIGGLVLTSEVPQQLRLLPPAPDYISEDSDLNVNGDLVVDNPKTEPAEIKVEADDDALSNKEVEALLQRVFDQFVFNQATKESSANTPTTLSTRALQNKFLRVLKDQFTEKIREKRNAYHASSFDGVPLPMEPISKFSQLEQQRLIASGLGKSAEEDALSHLLLPFHYDSLLPLDSNRIKADVDASQHWPQSFFVFRDVLLEARRLGVSVDHVLFVNPLQTACRGESISANAFQRNSLPLDATISIKYLAEGARNAAGASRSSKSRRSRPSGSSSRRKDSVTSLTNPAENAEVTGPTTAQTEGEQESKLATGGNEATFEGFLSDLEPTGDTPQKAAAPPAIQKPSLSAVSPVKSPNPTHETTSLDSWHPTEDDIIICTQNAFSDTHFKRTENWLNRALEQSRRRRRTAAEARLRYTWLCTTGRTQQRLQDPLVIAQIEQLRFSVQQRVAAAAAANAANAVNATGQTPLSPSPFVTSPGASVSMGVEANQGSTPHVHATPTKTGNHTDAPGALF